MTLGEEREVLANTTRKLDMAMNEKEHLRLTVEEAKVRVRERSHGVAEHNMLATTTLSQM